MQKTHGCTRRDGSVATTTTTTEPLYPGSEREYVSISGVNAGLHHREQARQKLGKSNLLESLNIQEIICI